MLKKLLVVLMVLISLAVGWAGETFTLKVVDSGTGNPTIGVYGNAFVALYNGNGKLAGTYEYAAGSWTKTD